MPFPAFFRTNIHFFHTIRHVYRSVWPPEKLSLALVPRSYVLRMISDLIICAIYPHSIGWILTGRQWIWGCGSYPYPHKTWHRTSSQRSTFSIRVQFTEARRRGLWKVWFFDYCDRQDITRLCEWILHGRRQDSCWELGHRVEARGFELWRSRWALSRERRQCVEWQALVKMGIVFPCIHFFCISA